MLAPASWPTRSRKRGRSARHRRSLRLARRAAAGGGVRRPSARRHVRAGQQEGGRRRPGRPAQRAEGGGYQGLAIVSTRAAAIGEFICRRRQRTAGGDPASPEQLADGTRPAWPKRSRPARSAGGPARSEIVRTRFSFESGVEWIATALGQPPPPPLLRIPWSPAKASLSCPSARGRGVIDMRRYRFPARGSFASLGAADLRVLLHTPLKPPDSAIPSGDREMARGLVRLPAPPRPHGGDAGNEPRGARCAGGRPRISTLERRARRPGCPLDCAAGGRLPIGSPRALRSLVHLSLLLSQARLAGAAVTRRWVCPM